MTHDYSSTLIRLNHCGDKIIFSYAYETRIYGTNILIEDYSIIYSLDFDKHTGSFSNLKEIYSHSFKPFENINEKEYFTSSYLEFSLNDSILYMIVSWLEYDERVFSFSVPSTASYKNWTKISLVQINLYDSNDFHELTFVPKPSANNYTNLNLSLNNLGEVILLSISTSDSDNNFHFSKIANQNSKSFDNKIIENYLPPMDYSQNYDVFNSFTGTLTPLYTFLRIEQSTDYSCSAEVNIKNMTSPDIGFTKYKWHIRDENGSLRVFEQFEPPVLHYSKDGNYAVQLFAQSPNGGGYAEWYVDTLRIKVPRKPVANFRVAQTDICLHQTVKFTNLSTSYVSNPQKPNVFIWDFGDGNTSTERNPEHEYKSPGVYTVSLLFDNGYCDSFLKKENYIKVNDAPLG